MSFGKRRYLPSRHDDWPGWLLWCLRHIGGMVDECSGLNLHRVAMQEKTEPKHSEEALRASEAYIIVGSSKPPDGI